MHNVQFNNFRLHVEKISQPYATHTKNNKPNVVFESYSEKMSSDMGKYGVHSEKVTQ